MLGLIGQNKAPGSFQNNCYIYLPRTGNAFLNGDLSQNLIAIRNVCHQILNER